MRVVAHLSDLHFGAVDPQLAEGVVRAVKAARPDLLVVSGDLTQRARSGQFRAARVFLDRLPKPRIVVPGNHDVPLWNVIARGITPLARYRRFITEDLSPYFGDAEIAVLGLSTARSMTLKNGRLNRLQVDTAIAHFAQSDPRAVKILVTHHPFDQPEASRSHAIVGRAAMAMTGFAKAGIDLILSGHLHLAGTGGSAVRYPGSQALLIMAGTATSIRRRGEANSFNLLRIDGSKLAVARMDWSGEDFVESMVQHFVHSDGHWHQGSEIPEPGIRARAIGVEKEP